MYSGHQCVFASGWDDCSGSPRAKSLPEHSILFENNVALFSELTRQSLAADSTYAK